MTSYLPLPDVIDPEETVSFCMTIPRNRLHMAAFWVVMHQLETWFAWDRDDDHTATLVAAVWKRYIAAARASLAEGSDCGMAGIIDARVDGCLFQVRYLPGGDWVTLVDFSDFAACIPAGATGPQGPAGPQGPQGPQGPAGQNGTDPNDYPPPGEDGRAKACDVAAAETARLQEAYEEYLSQLSASQDVLAAIGLMLAAIGFLEGSYALWIDNALMAQQAGIATLQAALSAAYWEDVQCAAYCAIPDTGYLLEGQREAWADGIEAISNANSEYLSRFLSAIELTTLHAWAMESVLTTGDCEDCECPDTWCQTFDFTNGQQDWTVFAGFGTWTGDGWAVSDDACARAAYIGLSLPSAANITSVSVLLNRALGSFCSTNPPGDEFGTEFIFRNGGSEVHRLTVPTATGVDVLVEDETFVGQVDVVRVGIWADYCCGAQSGSGEIKEVTICGTGTNPFT